MRYRSCLFPARSPLSLSACEFRASPTVLEKPSYGLVPQVQGKPRLYSVRDIGMEEVITTCPVQVIPTNEVSPLRRSALEDLCFDWYQDRYAVSLGAGAFVGHSDEPNCYWRADRATRTVAIHPRRSIFAGEELTIDYFSGRRRACAPVNRCCTERLCKAELPKPEMPKAVVTSDPTFGRTLIAVRDIRAGECISEAPARVVSNRVLKKFGKVTMLTDLAHTWLQRFAAVVLGIPAFVNHSFSANAFYLENRKRRTISLVAYENIAAGSELSMNYNGHPKDKSPLDWGDLVPMERPSPLVFSLN
ncbi:MAG: SET domain-containing protein-lysine N-methyltransferase [Candidatus Obscuribacterales bacterium]|nr:SET domain-containing protein-lysine N-methyltransferase [Candidatus Obscuribacterales bacterium]